jgi:hypothetical protein
MAKERKGAIQGAIFMSLTVLLVTWSGLFYVVAKLLTNHVSSAFWVAFSHMGLVQNGGFLWRQMYDNNFAVMGELIMDISFWGVNLFSILVAVFTLYFGLKTKHFASGDGTKQLDGLVRVDGLGALKSILAGGAKKEADFGVEVTKGVRISAVNETRHFAFLGGSGSGKTNSMLPLVHNAIVSGGTAILHDPKTDFTANLLQYKPIVIAPWLRNAHAWHVAKDIVTTPLAAQFAANMIPVPTGGNQVFALAARSVLTGIIVHLQESKPRAWSLKDIKAVFEADATGDNIQTILQEYYPQALQALSIDKTRASVLMNLSSSMQHIFALAAAWKDAKPGKMLSLRGYLAAAEKGGQRPLILQNNQAHKELSGCLFKAIFDVLVGRILGEMTDVSPKAPRKLWFFLDETKALPPLDCVESLLNQGRSKGVRVVLGCQNPFQISHWSNSADSDVWGNIATLFIGNLGEPESEKWGCELFGSGHFERWERSYSGGQRSGKGHNVQRQIDELDIIPRDELAELKVGEFFCRSKGSKYIAKFRFPICQIIGAKPMAPHPYFVSKSKEQLHRDAEQRVTVAVAEQCTQEQEEITVPPMENDAMARARAIYSDDAYQSAGETQAMSNA